MSISDALELERSHELPAGGVQAAPEGEVEGHEDDREQVAHGGHRHRERDVAARLVGDDVRDVPRRAAGHEDHPEGDRAPTPSTRVSRKVSAGRRTNWSAHPEGDDLGPPGRLTEVLGAGVEGDTEEDRAMTIRSTVCEFSSKAILMVSTSSADGSSAASCGLRPADAAAAGGS